MYRMAIFQCNCRAQSLVQLKHPSPNFGSTWSGIQWDMKEKHKWQKLRRGRLPRHSAKLNLFVQLLGTITCWHVFRAVKPQFDNLKQNRQYYTKFGREPHSDGSSATTASMVLVWCFEVSHSDHNVRKLLLWTKKISGTWQNKQVMPTFLSQQERNNLLTAALHAFPLIKNICQ